MKTIESLQRELLAICNGGSAYTTWAKVNGIPENEHINFASQIGKLGRINAIREQIKAINPNAALYYGWGGVGDYQPEESK